MKRRGAYVLRIGLRTLAAMSLILCIASGVVWVRSHWVEDRVIFSTFDRLGFDDQTLHYEAQIWRGSVTLIRREINSARARAPRFELLTLDMGGLDSGFVYYGGKTHLGFGALTWRFQVSQVGAMSGSDTPDVESNVIFPLWSVLVMFLIAPLLALRGVWVRMRGVRRRRMGLCSTCGYDLRASAARCPECGNRIPPTNKVARHAWSRELLPLIPALLIIMVIIPTVLFAGLKHVKLKQLAYVEHERVEEATMIAIRAVDNDDEAEFRRQLKAGARLHPRIAGERVLKAIERGRPRMAMLLVEAGADLSVEEGAALPAAVYRRHYFLALRMLERGAVVNAKDSLSGRTALNLCASEMRSPDQLELVAAILKHGANPNLTDEYGNSPLHRLAEPSLVDGWNRVDFAVMLLEHGADLKLRNTDGKTARDLAQAHQNKALAEFLKSRGGAGE